MGCTKTNENNYPFLFGNVEKGNEEQKNFCMKIKDTYKHSKTIKCEIKASEKPFFIKLKIKNTIYDITNKFINNNEEEVNNILQAIYNKIDGK